MAEVVRLPDLGAAIQSRLNIKLAKMKPDSPEMRRLLTTIGLRLVQETKLNVRKEGIIDTGNLFNSIQMRIQETPSGNKLSAGAYGVPYAAIHEFGGADMGPRQRAAMFARLREEGKIGRPGKGVVFGGTFRARPYLRPAFQKVTQDLDRMLRNLIR